MMSNQKACKSTYLTIQIILRDIRTAREKNYSSFPLSPKFGMSTPPRGNYIFVDHFS